MEADKVDAVQLKKHYERLYRHATCANCDNYRPAPTDFVRVACGWCSELLEFIEAHNDASECYELVLSREYIRENEWME